MPHGALLAIVVLYVKKFSPQYLDMLGGRDPNTDQVRANMPDFYDDIFAYVYRLATATA